MNKVILFILILALIISPIVYADIITPTETTVYFERNGQLVNEKIDFTVRGYGYSWSPGPSPDKAPGTYTPEVVFSFSATYNKYGDKIYKDYYMNYRQIDYYEFEGTMQDGRSFKIKNLSDFTSSCNDTWIEYYSRICEIRFDLNADNVEWSEVVPVKKGFWESISCFFRRLFGGIC